MRRVLVLPLAPLDRFYTYEVPPEMTVVLGDVVRIPFGRRSLVGVVWAEATQEELPKHPLKTLQQKYNTPPLPAAIRDFVVWVASYTLTPLGRVLKMVLPVPDALGDSRPAPLWHLTIDTPPSTKWTSARARVFEVLKNSPRSKTELLQEARVSPSVLDGMVAEGWVAAVTAIAEAPIAPTPLHIRHLPLSVAQKEAADAIVTRVEAAKAHVFFLDGVTGSGKTEVYFEGIAAAMATGRQSLILLPEIALSVQWLARFRDRFGADPLVWHSTLTPKQRRENWRRIVRGEAPVVVGARSALFLPFPNLGYIIVDEEHDATYKQDDSPTYHARDMAVVRAQLGSCPLVLASATPSLETYLNTLSGKYERLHLPSRFGVAKMPEIHPIDRRSAKRGDPESGKWISPPLREAVKEALARGEQSLLFLNRRGYAPLMLCRRCGHRVACPDCATWLVYHQARHHVQCHQCGHQATLPTACPTCGAEEAWVPCGPGVERIAEEAKASFPDARLAIVTSDTLQHAHVAEQVIRQITAGEIDIIVGTQVIAKGHHFPQLTCVGIIDGDIGLSGGDLRAAERTYQLLTQVSGRAGRAAHPGQVWVQTYQPTSPLLTALAHHARDDFLNLEATGRAEAHMPPYSRLIALILSGPDEGEVEMWAKRLGQDLHTRVLPTALGVDVLGPAPAPLTLLRKRYRWRLLLRMNREVRLQNRLRAWLEELDLPGRLRLQVDVDPYHFL